MAKMADNSSARLQIARRAEFSGAVAALSIFVLAAYLVLSTLFIVNTRNLIGLGGAPVGYDFATFYEAARFAETGKAAAAYDDPTLIAAIKARFPGDTLRLPWNYPPIFQLLLLPFGFLPYLVAWASWLTLSYGAYGLLVWPITRWPWRGLMLLFPGAALNLALGQNGLLSTILTGGGVLLLRSRPLSAGILLGLMSYKPHLAIPIPFILLLAGEWKALASMVGTVGTLILSSIAFLGTDPWIGFLGKTMHASSIAQSSSSGATNIPAVLVVAQNFGLSHTAAIVLHAVVAAGAVWLCLDVWRRTRSGTARAGALAAALLVVAPYVRPYDQALLALPIIAMAAEALSEARRPLLIAAAWLMPAMALASPISRYGIAALVPIVALAVIRRQASANEVGGAGDEWAK